MTALHEYEEWLDTLDARLLIRDGDLTSTLGVGFSMPLNQLSTEPQILEAAGAFWSSLQETGDRLPHPLPKPYLLRRFHELASGNRYGATFERFIDQFQDRHPELKPEEVSPRWRNHPARPLTRWRRLLTRLGFKPPAER